MRSFCEGDGVLENARIVCWSAGVVLLVNDRGNARSGVRSIVVGGMEEWIAVAEAGAL